MGDWLWVIGYWVLDALRAIGRFAIGYGIWDIGYGVWAMGDWLLAIGNGVWVIGDFFANNFRYICVCQRFILILQKIV
jgi:hypothetical protein